MSAFGFCENYYSAYCSFSGKRQLNCSDQICNTYGEGILRTFVKYPVAVMTPFYIQSHFRSISPYLIIDFLTRIILMKLSFIYFVLGKPFFVCFYYEKRYRMT